MANVDIEQWVSALESRGDTRQAALRQLSAQGAAAVPLLRALLAGGGRAAWAAAELLGRLQAPDVYADLLAAVRAPDPILASQALKAVLAYEDEAVALQLVEAMPQAHLMVQQSIVKAWQRLGDARVVPSLLALLQTAPSPTMRCAAIQGLAVLGDASLLPQIRPYLTDPDHHVRQWAADVVQKWS